MRHFVVGDLQGHIKPLKRILKYVDFSRTEDELWVAGDMVNRGPHSLKVVKFLMDLPNCKVVLGNHDIHFLAVALGYIAPKKKDTFHDILRHADCRKIVDWMLHQPLVHFSETVDLVMSHAGIPHIWSLDKALSLSAEIQRVWANPDSRHLYFKELYGNYPHTWQENLEGAARWRTTTNYLTRMRYVKSDGEEDFSAKESSPPDLPGFKPWFEYLDTQRPRLVFGHWAALMGKTNRTDIIALDTGYVWGNELSVFEVSSETIFRITKGQKKIHAMSLAHHAISKSSA